MFGGFILTSVFKRHAGVAPEGHEVRKEETVGGMNFVESGFGLLRRTSNRMAGEGQTHGSTAPVIPTAAPFFASGPLHLRGPAVVEKETWIAFESVEVAPIGELVGGANDMTGPVTTAFLFAGVEQDKVVTLLGFWKVAIGRMKAAEAVGWRIQRFGAHGPDQIVDSFAEHVGNLDTSALQKRHWKVGRELEATTILTHGHGE